MESLRNRIVFITGANGGIGSVIALTFAKHGCRLALTGRNKASLEQVGKLCEEAGLPKDKILILVGNLRVDDDIQRIVTETVSAYGVVDVLVNNASLVHLGNTETLKLNDLDEIYDVNVRAAVSLTQKLIPHMKNSKGGSIVNISSVASTIPVAEMAGYGMMKAALDQFTRCLAIDLSSYNIRVNSITPGSIQTDMLIKCGFMSSKEEADQYYKDAAEKYPLGCVGTPEDVANGVLFLASDAAAFMTGASMVMDGGASHVIKAF